MTLVIDKFKSLLPPNTKVTPSQWMTLNAPCCHHRGHNPDKRRRGGIMFPDNGIVFHCFNCGYKASWKPGQLFNLKIKNLSKWLGATDDELKQIIFESLKTESVEVELQKEYEPIFFKEKNLPESTRTIKEWINSSDFESVANELYVVIEYITKRGFDPLDPIFHWSSIRNYQNRVIVPFYWKGKIVGNIARHVLSNGNYRYLTDHPSGFVFNFDNQQVNQKYTLVTEGPFDALSVHGVAVLTNTISEQQSRIIDSLNSEVIVIPDQDQAGLVLFDDAIKYNWSVACPTWKEGIKDCNEAVNHYGQLFVVVDAIMTSVKGNVKINLAKKQMKQKLERYKQ